MLGEFHETSFDFILFFRICANVFLAYSTRAIVHWEKWIN